MAPQNPLVARIATSIARLVAGGGDDLVIADLAVGSMNLAGSTSQVSRSNRGEELLGDLFVDGGQDRMTKYADFREMGRDVAELKRSLRVKRDFVFGGPSESGDKSHGGMEITVRDGADDGVRGIVRETSAAINPQRLMLGKYTEAAQLGDSPTELVFVDKRLVWTKPILPERFDVVWDAYGRLSHYRVRAGTTGVEGTVRLEPFQMLHFAYDRQRGHKYGTSNWETARRIWRSMESIEDILGILALLKAGNRKSVAYPVPDSTTPNQLPAWRAALKGDRPQFFGADGKQRRRLAALLELDDLIYPYRMSGKPPLFHNEAAPDLGPLRELWQLWQERYFVATGTPAALCGIERNVNARATLEQQGLHFVTTSRQEQQEVADYTLLLFYVVLLVAGRRPQAGDIVVRMPRVSAFDDLLRAQVQKLRAETVKLLGIDVGLPMLWILKTVLGIPEDEALELLDEWGGALSDYDPTAETAAAIPSNERFDRLVREMAGVGEMVDRARETYLRYCQRTVRRFDPAELPVEIPTPDP